eukprot:9110227-Lingulodinium_polyedra.AAC.1
MEAVSRHGDSDVDGALATCNRRMFGTFMSVHACACVRACTCVYVLAFVFARARARDNGADVMDGQGDNGADVMD